MLSFLTDCHDSAATEAGATIASEIIQEARTFILSKEKTTEFKTQLTRERALELYLFMEEFKAQFNGPMESIHSSLKAFILGGE